MGRIKQESLSHESTHDRDVVQSLGTPGKRTLTMSAGSRKDSLRPTQRESSSEQLDARRGPSEDWSDVVFRPDLHQSPTVVLPGAEVPGGPVFPMDRQEEERRQMEEEARRWYERVLIETGKPPKWDELVRHDPRFARFVEEEDQRIYDEAMMERARRRGTELGLMQRIEEERQTQPPPRQASLSDVPQEAFDRILGFLGPKEHLTLREVDRQSRDRVRDHHQARVPYRSRESFASATTGHYPQSFSKSEYTNRDVDLRKNMSLSWQEYQKGVELKDRKDDHPGYVERMDDNRFLFHEERVDPRIREVLEQTGHLFSPSEGIWTPQMNDAWLLGLLHAGLPIHLLSRPDLEALYDFQANRPTQTGRELLLMLHSGWRVVTNEEAGDMQEQLAPFESGGIVLVPPRSGPPAKIQDAESSNAKSELETFSSTTEPQFQEPEIRRDHRLSSYDTITREKLRKEYIGKRIQQLMKLARSYVNEAVALVNLEASLGKAAQKKRSAIEDKISTKSGNMKSSLLKLEEALRMAGLHPEERRQVIEQILEQIEIERRKIKDSTGQQRLDELTKALLGAFK